MRRGPLPSLALRTNARGRILGGDRWISTEPSVPRTTSNDRAAPTDSFRLSISAPSRIGVYFGVPFNCNDPKGPVRADVVGLAEATYLLAICSRRALRACNTDAKIGEFHMDSNFSNILAPRDFLAIAYFADNLQVGVAIVIVTFTVSSTTGKFYTPKHCVRADVRKTARPCH